MMKNSRDFSMEDAIRAAQSPQGQALLEVLQRTGTPDAQHALERAMNGDPRKAQEIFQALMCDPEARNLLARLEDSL